MRVNLPDHATAVIDEIADRRRMSKRGVMLMAVGFLQAADKAAREGMTVGAVRDQDVLDYVILPRSLKEQGDPR